MSTTRANLMAALALILATAAFVNSLLPATPPASAAPIAQDNPVAQATPPLELTSVSAAQQLISLQAAAFTSTVPNFIGYQGVLRDGEGRPIGGPVNVTFRIYSDVTEAPTNCGASASKCLWEERHNNVTVRDGRFSVLLGSVSTPIAPTLITSPERFIGIQVEGYDEMQPRQRFSSVPYAMWSQHAYTASGLGNPDGTVVDGVHVLRRLYFHQSGLSPSDGLPYARLEESYGMRFNSPDPRWVFSSKPSVLIGYQPAGQTWGTGNLLVEGSVGIGTTAPQSKLHVAGDVTLDGWLRMGGTDFWMLANDRGDGGRAMVHGGGDSLILNFANDFPGGTYVDSNLTLNGDLITAGNKPIFFARYLVGSDRDFNTNIPEANYNCGIAGWAVVDVDVQENFGGDYIAETFPSGGTWWIKARYHWQANPGDWYVTVICVDTQLSDRYWF